MASMTTGWSCFCTARKEQLVPSRAMALAEGAGAGAGAGEGEGEGELITVVQDPHVARRRYDVVQDRQLAGAVTDSPHLTASKRPDGEGSR